MNDREMREGKARVVKYSTKCVKKPKIQLKRSKREKR